MPLPAGTSDKFGNRYEGKWTVLQILRILRERARSICLEPPLEDGCEFSINSNGCIEYHQVKRQHSASGRWKLIDLQGVLKYFKSKLAKPETSCVFISTNSAYQLEELSDRSRRAGSYERFNKEFLPDTSKNVTSSSNWRSIFKQLCEMWDLTNEPEIAHNFLTKIQVKTIDEYTLSDRIINEIEPLLTGTPESICSILAQFVLENVNCELNSQDIWSHLEKEHGLKKNAWADNQLLHGIITRLLTQFTDPLAREVILQNLISSASTSNLVEKIKNSKYGVQGVLVVGEAGVGKSCVILEVVQSLCNENWLVLPIRVSTLYPVRSPKELGEQLGLPGSPAQVLSEMAGERPALLVVDQLDALSLISGRNPDFFDCFEALFREAANVSTLRLLVACRKYDLENDHRFRQLSGNQGILEEVKVGKLNKETVLEIVEKIGLSSSKLKERQIELLSLSIHLKLFSQVADDEHRNPLEFNSAKELFDHFWDFKQQILRKRLNTNVNWIAVIDILCEYMNTKQELSVPKLFLDAYQNDYLVMISEHVLIEMSGKISFFHESFFDYCFARRFFAKGKEISRFLKEGEQHLFKRAQVRQILLLQRANDFTSYCKNVNDLLIEPSIRFHIKEVVASILSNIPDPKTEELDIVLKTISEGEHEIRSYLFQTISRSHDWFDLFQTRQIISTWLNSDKQEDIDRAITFCNKVSRIRSEIVATLFIPMIGLSSEWDKRIFYILFYADVSCSEKMYLLLLKCLETGLFDNDNSHSRELNHILYPLKEKKPDWACTAYGLHFNKFYEKHPLKDEDRGLEYGNCLPNERIDEISLIELAKATPAEFIENFLSLILKIIRDNSDSTGDLPYLDKFFLFRQFGESYGMSATLLRAATIALELVAKENPDKLRVIISGLEEYKDSDTIQFLITCAYTANGVEFADEAVEYLCERHSRLHSGYSGDGHWATRLLITAIAEKCKIENYGRLEKHILGYHTKWEKSAGGFKSYGWAQFELLNALPACRKSIKAQSKIDELRRKFLVDDVEPPEPMEFKVVESPVSENAQLKMTDEQWKRAIAKYNNEDHYKFRRDMKGDVLQLSAVLENATKREPVRFANLGIQLPDDTHPYYFNGILRGLKETATNLEDVLPFCYRCHSLPNRACGRWIHEPITKFASVKIPEEALHLVGWYATEDSDPEKEMWKTKAENSSNYYYGGDILTAAINSVRGSACGSLSKLVRYDKNRIPQLIPYIEKAVIDSNISVRCTAASIVLAILEHDPDSAITLFIRLCDCGDELLGTHYIESFLNYATIRHYDKLKPTLVRMLHSQNATVKQAGSRQICVSALFHDDAIKYSDNCISGDNDLQYGVAQVCAANIHKKDFSWFLMPRLIKLFDSEYKEVRNEACRCFHYFSGDMVGSNTELIEAYIDSKAFLEDPFAFIHALEETTSKIPDSIIYIAEKVVNEIKGGTKNQDRYSTIDKICKLLMRVYCDSTEPEIIKRCLDCFDEFLQLGVYGITDVLSSQDR